VLREWGIVINHKQMVMDEEKSIRSAANTVVCQYADSFASSLHSSVSSADSPVNTIVVEAVPLTLLFGQADTDIIANGAVLKTYPSSYVTVDGEQIKGEYTVMALATKAEYVNNVATRTHVLVCGSTYFTELTYASSYGNNEIIFNAMKMMGQTANTIDIEWKRTDDKTLKLDTGIAQNLTVVLSAVIPSIVLILGICVAIHRRKYR